MKFLQQCLLWCGRVVVAGGLIAFCGFVALHYHDSKNRLTDWDADKARDDNRPLPVRVMTVAQESIEQVVGGTCVSEASMTAPVFAVRAVSSSDRTIDLTRVIDKVLVQAGDRVEVGQQIALMRVGLLKANLAERKQTLNVAQQRMRRLQKAETAGYAHNFELDDVRVQVAQAELALTLIQQEIDDSAIRSPLAGLVEELTIVDNEVLGAETPVANIVCLDPLHIVMDFPIEHLNLLEVGQAAEVTLDGFHDEVFQGKVLRISSTANHETRVLPVVIEVANSDGRLRAGLPGFARIRDTSAGIKVPATAVVAEGDGNMVFVVDENEQTVVSRRITPGARLSDGYVFIRKGLNSGDQIVVAGQQALVSGDPVNANWQQWTHRTEESSAQSSVQTVSKSTVVPAKRPQTAKGTET